MNPHIFPSRREVAARISVRQAMLRNNGNVFAAFADLTQNVPVEHIDSHEFDAALAETIKVEKVQ